MAFHGQVVALFAVPFKHRLEWNKLRCQAAVRLMAVNKALASSESSQADVWSIEPCVSILFTIWGIVSLFERASEPCCIRRCRRGAAAKRMAHMFEGPFKLSLEWTKFVCHSEDKAYGDQQGSGLKRDRLSIPSHSCISFSPPRTISIPS